MATHPLRNWLARVELRRCSSPRHMNRATVGIWWRQRRCSRWSAKTYAQPTNDRVPRPEILRLGQEDSPEMVALATLTKPGPFGRRTHELGTYLGIRCDGKLVAMAGERLKVPGYTEVSAVCTHPDHLGKGYARALMTEIMRGIREGGDIPMLHVRADNARAIELYERLGFRTRLRRALRSAAQGLRNSALPQRTAKAARGDCI